MSTPTTIDEAKSYYHGLPSSPVLVARAGFTHWNMPSRGQKELRPVGKHLLSLVWEKDLALKLHALLGSLGVKWTSTDVVRIGIHGESSAPIVLWIGVVPNTLTGDTRITTVSQCLDLLLGYGITDVDVEIRESLVAHSAGPALLGPYSDSDDPNLDPTVNIRKPLTATLGFPICAETTPHAQGSSGLFIAEGRKNTRLLLTARHVVFPHQNNPFVHTNNQPRFNVKLFGDPAFENYLSSIDSDISSRERIVEGMKGRLRRADGSLDLESKRGRQGKINKATKELRQVQAFHDDVSKHWTPENRVLGHVILSPPIRLGCNSEGGNEGYTEDWAIIEVDRSKVNASNFSGNVIDLGTKVSAEVLVDMMNSNVNQNAQPFKYPAYGLLWLKGTIPDDEMRHPDTVFDQGRGDNTTPSIIVIKHGDTSGVTVGRANNLMSFVRKYDVISEGQVSIEWAIFPFDLKSCPFSEKGDSGSIVVDGQGRIGGLLTGGSSKPLSTSNDITYATPISFLLKRIEEEGIQRPYPVSSRPPYPFHFYILYFPSCIYRFIQHFLCFIFGFVWGVGFVGFHFLLLLLYMAIAVIACVLGCCMIITGNW